MQMEKFGKLKRRSVDAAPGRNANSRRLIVSDRASGQRYLIDTGSDFCCFPRRLAKGRSATSEYQLSAANGSSIKTYGSISLHLNIGLRRDFHWRFYDCRREVPIIGSDFLSFYNLLPDLRNKCLIDGLPSMRHLGMSNLCGGSQVG